MKILASGATRRFAAAAGISLGLLAQANSVQAFKPKGHEDLESTAYEALRQAATVSGTSTSGADVLQRLIESKVLQCEKGTHCTPSALRARSGGPDASLERQFDTRDQAFHFMASNEDVAAAASSCTPKQDALDRARPRNLALMRLLFDETVVNPVGAFKAGRGIYVLMHMVVDSFSREHTERDSSNRLVTIKGWKLLRLRWPAVATAPNGTSVNKPHQLPTLLHNVVVGADLDWRVPEGGPLSTEGQRAVDAVKDLLLTVYHASKAKKDAKTVVSEQNRVWKAFTDQHFAAVSRGPCPAPDLTARMPLAETDSFPSTQIGVGIGGSLSDTPDKGFVQLTAEQHVVPYRATGFISRVMLGAIAALRMPITRREEIDPKNNWYRGSEATLVGGISLQIPWLQWLGIYVGGGVRSDRKLEAGPAAALVGTFYFPRYVALSLRYEPNFWLVQSMNTVHNISFNISLFSIHARTVNRFDYTRAGAPAAAP